MSAVGSDVARGHPARRAVVVVAVLVAGGAVAGVVWELLWTPPPGVALAERFSLTSSGLTESFAGTALYVLVAVATGLLLGAVVALRADGAELVTLGAVVLGSLLAAAVMAVVGAALGPPDADDAARGLEDYAPLRQDLRIEGVGPYLAFPSGALLGAGTVFLSLSRGSSSRHRRRGAGPAHPDPEPDGGRERRDDPTAGLGEKAPPR